MDTAKKDLVSKEIRSFRQAYRVSTGQDNYLQTACLRIVTIVPVC